MEQQTTTHPVRDFVDSICTRMYCHDHLKMASGTQRITASRPIRPNKIVLKIPRSWTIWDLDALGDDYIQQELVIVLHPVQPAAFLAAYLARLLNQVKKKKEKENNLAETTAHVDPILEQYLLHVLPTYDELLLFHPLLWTERDTKSKLGGMSTYDHVTALQSMVSDEYTAFTMASAKFKNGY
jgi:hypothetical protein